jgi:uncharacterized protein YaiL (DUF2058 family)
MARSTQEKEERKLTLPTGHPQAGYVSPDLSGLDGVGDLPEDEQKAHDERNKAQEEEAAAIAESEDKVAREEEKARAAERDKRIEAEQKQTATASTAPSSSKASS